MGSPTCGQLHRTVHIKSTNIILYAYTLRELHSLRAYYYCTRDGKNKHSNRLGAAVRCDTTAARQTRIRTDDTCTREYGVRLFACAIVCVCVRVIIKK